jgi:predicted outer membrane repeat protein
MKQRMVFSMARRRASAGIAAAIVSLTFLVSLNADTLTVTRTDSTGPGSFPVILNQAIAAAGDSVIEFSVSGTITLIAPLPTITNNLTINGRDGVVISGGSLFPLFTFGPGTTNTLSKLVLAGGFRSGGNGGAVSNAGTLFIDTCAFKNNGAKNGNGGAIYSSGPLTIGNSTFEASSSIAGGAIACSSNLTVSKSSFSNWRVKRSRTPIGI